MTKPNPGARKPNKLDLAELRRLVTLMEARNLSKVEIEMEDKRILVERGAVAAASPAPEAAPAAAPPLPAAAAPAAAPEASSVPEGAVEIPSPMVGTFYRAPSPDAAPYVEVGDLISTETVVCIVEAMKVMNEIKAEASGQILEILVQNGEPVEYGQPLFLVNKPGP